ncbi:MAG: bacitracin ABC transporter ATP-binding protein [Clostridiales bacterium 43-6]|nr:MAG: bacitracin ABC transporter ATP-binding protein [Clostridiales bacterium 43-6]
MEIVLQTENLSKSFGSRKIIDNISLSVYAGEVFGFLGPNGAGKTTTIKMIMGFLGIDSGSISVCGLNLKKDYENAMAQVGGIVENPEMYKTLSGLTNLKMYARLHDGVTPERIQEVVRLVGMEQRIKEKVKKYSLGMKQRVGLAQAILHRPKLLILDEPTNGLDPAGIRELRDILKNLAHKENTAVLVSSHLLAEMQLMCDRVGIINNGKLIGVKQINELLDDATVTPRYRFYTSEAAKASEILSSDYSVVLKNVTGEYIELQIYENKVPDINFLLAGGGVPITGIHKVETSLEEAFLNITGGGISIA